LKGDRTPSRIGLPHLTDEDSIRIMGCFAQCHDGFERFLIGIWKLKQSIPFPA
jgi:hypothetical protein